MGILLHYSNKWFCKSYREDSVKNVNHTLWELLTNRTLVGVGLICVTVRTEST